MCFPIPSYPIPISKSKQCRLAVPEATINSARSRRQMCVAMSNRIDILSDEQDNYVQGSLKMHRNYSVWYTYEATGSTPNICRCALRLVGHACCLQFPLPLVRMLITIFVMGVQVPDVVCFGTYCVHVRTAVPTIASTYCLCVSYYPNFSSNLMG